jgi:site-specific recombinase XerD
MRIPLSAYPPWTVNRQSFSKEIVFHAPKTKRFPQEWFSQKGSASNRSGSFQAHGAGQPRITGFRPGLRFRDERFYRWYCSEPRLAFGKHVVLRYRIQLESRRLSVSTINLRLAAVRRLAFEAADCGLLSPELAAGIQRVKGAKKLGVRLGNWLTVEQCRSLLQAPDGQTLKGRRDRAILAILLGCGLRRAEVAKLQVRDVQQREDHWALVDLMGKGRHIRTVPVPDWVKAALDEWTSAAGVTDGRVFRCVSRKESVWGKGITEKVIWHIVRASAKRAGIQQFAPHDCRRSCARLCHAAGGELEQIQFLLGHVSVETTERYLGCKQRLRQAVNDKIGLEP